MIIVIWMGTHRHLAYLSVHTLPIAPLANILSLLTKVIICSAGACQQKLCSYIFTESSVKCFLNWFC